MPSATEKPKIPRMKTGAIHLIITVNNFSLLKVPSVAFTSSTIAFGLITKPMITQVKNATIGIITLLLTKSKKVRMSSNPNGFMWLQILKPKADGIPTINVNPVTIMQAVFLPSFVLSMTIDTIVSINEMEDVSAAKNTSKKKIAPIKPPIGISLNTSGRVTNIKVGPGFVSPFTIEEYAAGTIISPAKNAIAVSNISI